MIDRLVIQGVLGTPQERHQTCLSQVTYSRFLHSKTKLATTFVSSPMSGAQIEARYWVDNVGGIPTALIQISLPVASAILGHNYIHADLKTLGYEVTCAALMTKITLHALGFTTEEVGRFMKSSKTQLVEVTWHRDTASARARLNLQKRTKRFFDAQLLLSARHDIAVRDVVYQEGNGKPGLLVTLKNGDQFRQYGKYDQVKSRTRKSRSKACMSDATRLLEPHLLKKIETHVRNELLFGAETLERHELSHPSSWTAKKFLVLIEHTWQYIGFPPKGVSVNASDQGFELSAQAESTWQRYIAGEDVQKALPSYTFTRHRALIKKRWGKDIADKRHGRGARPENIGRQLGYKGHWEPAGDERKLVICEVTAPTTIPELRSGLAFVETGELPAFDNENSREAWLLRWKPFIDREGGHKVHGAGQSTDAKNASPPDQPTATPRELK